MELAILIGLQASGKSTFHRERLAKTHAHVSKDNFPSAKNKQARQMRLVREALAEGRSVAVDNTNPQAADRAPLIEAAREFGARVVGYRFESRLRDCLQRNAAREGKARIPEPGVRATLARFEPARFEEGFDELFDVRLAKGGGFHVRPAKALSKAVAGKRPPKRRSGDFEARMREGECFHTLRLPPGMWTVVRVDGRGFSKFTESRYEKPFDPKFRDAMAEAARALLEDFQALYAYAESDEISLLFPPSWNLFDRELEKIVSVSAGVASAAFALASGEMASFDGRVWLGADEGSVVDYFRWRQSDAARCALNGWCYWKLREEDLSPRKAGAMLDGKTISEKNELLYERGMNFNEAPQWQRRGIGLYWETFQKKGYNPKESRETLVERRRVKIDLKLPMKDKYTDFLLELIRDEKSGEAPPSKPRRRA